MDSSVIYIKDISGEILFPVLIASECEKVEELMKSDYIQLSWNSDSNDVIPAGSYIEYSGERYLLLEPYSPTQKNEAKYNYQPQFQSKVMSWGKVPFFMYTYSSDNAITGREPDWSLTDNPANFMSVVCKAIKSETGETWTYAVDASLPASATLSFQSIDIFSALNSIANAFDTEWWVDKSNKVLHLSKAEHGTAVELKVGLNINTPSVTNNKEGYYTRFYAFGSTRNIVQDYQGANVNNLINKRLTLDPKKYPGGYKDINSGLSPDEIFSKILVFDDVYPSSSLTISDVRVRLMWTLDESGNKVQIGTKDGEPVYDQYAIWYFSIPGFAFNNSVYSKENPDGMLISGKVLSVHFETGTLQDREFELIYHDKEETVSSADGTSVSLKPSDYEIKFKEEGTYIIPAITSLVPNDGDKIVLFNIRMPQEYVDSAYLELEAEMNKEIARLSSDLNNYQFSSNPVAFNESNPNLSIGRKVLYINGGYSYTTRVIKLITKLDYEYLQTITIGNDKIKGNTQEIKEEVASANKDINLLSVINDMTASLQQSYQRTQKMMLDGFAAIKNIWQLKEDSNGNKYALSAYDIVTEGGVTMYGIGNHTASTIMDGILVDGTTIGIVDGRLSVIGDIGGGTANGIRVNGSLYSPDEDGIITIPNYPTSLAWNDITGKPGWIGSTKPSYSWDEINSKPSVFPTDWENVSGKPSWIGTNKPFYDFSEISNKPTTLAGYGITDAYTKDGISELLDGYVTLDGAQDITGVKSFVNGVNIGDILVKKHSDRVVELDGDLIVTGSITIFAQGSHTASTILDALPIDETTLSKEGNKLSVIGGVGGASVDGIILNGTTYSPNEETKLITLPDYPTFMDWGSITNTPSTLAGYGITDAYTKAESNANYVIKSGDTMTGSLYINSGDIGTTLKLFSTAGDTYIRMINKGVDIGGFGVSAEYGVYMYNNNSASRTYVNSDGELLHNDYTVLHLGNYSGVLDNRYLYWTRVSDIDANNLVKGDVPHIYEVSGGANMPSNNSWHQIMSWGTGDGNYHFQIANGYITDGLLAFRNKIAGTWGEWHTVLHNGNFHQNLDSSYVLKSGDTMEGQLSLVSRYGIILRPDNTNFTSGIAHDIAGNECIALWAKNSATSLRWHAGIDMSDLTSGSMMNITPDFEISKVSGAACGYIDGNTIWHAGNDGSGSGLDADMLDGYHESNFVRSWWTNTPGYKCDTYNDRSLIGFTYSNNAPFNGGFIDVSIRYYGFYLGTDYRTDGPLYYRKHGNPGDGGMGAWQQLARITDNVASATRLQTPRTIWGQSFDGTGNISGWLSGATTIECSTGVRCRNICIETESDGTAGSRGSEINCFTSPLYLQHATTNNIVMCYGGGNVVIGMIAPDYRLHVNGDIGANGLIYSISNGITSSFGAENSSYCHIRTNAPAFWFSSELRINGSILPYDGNHWIGTADSPWGYVFSNGWFRSLGDTGWYNQTYDGGIYMTDSSYVRVYKGKRFYTSSSYYDAISTEGGFTCYANRSYSWGNGFGTINQSIPNDSGQTPLIVAYRSGSSGATNGSNRLFSVECLNSGMEVDLLFGGDIQFLFSNSGNFLANGGITMYYSSDRNLKVNIRPVTNASERLMSIGGVYDFEYIDSEVERNSIYAGTHTGLIYQNVKGGVMDCMAYEREDGKGALNYIDPSFISLLAAVEIEHEGRIQVLESENKMLKANNEELMNRINELERRVA